MPGTLGVLRGPNSKHGATSRPRRAALVVAVATVVGLVASACGSSGTSAEPPAHTTTRPDPAAPFASGLGTGWKPVLDDEFSGATLDTHHWSTCYWWSTTTCTNGSTHELEGYVPANASVGTGALHLVADRKPTFVDGKLYSYSSGMISGARGNRALFSFKYGYVEARARVPAGIGLWSALWMLPADRTTLPEIDIFEVVGEQPGVDAQHVHWRDAGGNEQQLGNNASGTDLSSGWHVYGLLWEPDAISWYVDGARTWTVRRAGAVPQVPMYVIADLAVGGYFTHAPDTTTPFPSELRFDYLRVWQRN